MLLGTYPGNSQKVEEPFPVLFETRPVVGSVFRNVWPLIWSQNVQPFRNVKRKRMRCVIDALFEMREALRSRRNYMYAIAGIASVIKLTTRRVLTFGDVTCPGDVVVTKKKISIIRCYSDHHHHALRCFRTQQAANSQLDDGLSAIVQEAWSGSQRLQCSHRSRVLRRLTKCDSLVGDFINKQES